MQASASIQTPGGAAASFFSWTVIVLILLAVAAVMVIAGMIYGNRLARDRHRALDAAEERAEEAGIESTPAPTPGDVAPAPELAKEHDPADRAVERRDEVESAAAAPVADERVAEPATPASAPAHPHPSAAAPLPPSPNGRGKGPATRQRRGKGEGDPVSTATEPADIAPDTLTESEPAGSPAVETASPPAPAPAPEPAAPPLAGALALTTIKGLGPKVAALLAEQGITRVDQLAALSDADAAALDAQLGNFAGRMARDRWIDQARLLASGDTAAYEAEFGKLG